MSVVEPTTFAEGAAGEQPRSGLAPTRVWLVRHGESEWNVAARIQGQARAPGLTQRGRDQAAEVAEQLAGCGATLVLTSDLRRAVETAAPIAERLGVPVVEDVRLRERALGAAEGQRVADVPAHVLGVADGRVIDAEARPAGGESTRELVARVRDLLEAVAVAPPAPRLVMVSHGGVLRAALGYAAGTPPEVMGWPALPNVTVCELSLPLQPPGQGGQC